MLFLNTFEASLCLMQVSLCPRDQPIPWGMLLHFLRFWSSFVQAEICEDYPKWLPWQPCPNCWTFRRGKTAKRSTEEWPHTDGDCFELQREVKKCTENHGKPSSKPPSKDTLYICISFRFWSNLAWCIIDYWAYHTSCDIDRNTKQTEVEA